MNTVGQYSFIAYIKMGDSTSMQFLPDTTTHKVIAASTDCNSCWSDGYIAQKYDISTRENSGAADVLTKTIKL